MNSLRQILTPESIVNNNNNNDTVRKLVAFGWLLAVKYVQTVFAFRILLMNIVKLSDFSVLSAMDSSSKHAVRRPR